MSNNFAKALFGGATALDLFGNVSDAQSAWRTASQNRRAALDDAKETEEAGAMDIRQFDREARQRTGANLSAIAGSNTALSGSAMDIMADTLAQMELERGNRQRTTRRKAEGLRSQAADYGRVGAATSRQKYLKASGSLLKSAADMLGLF
ncbi:hypothetical protein ACR42D_09965 [Desulfovibrio caledoniensis]